jgi:hypothetical protein
MKRRSLACLLLCVSATAAADVTLKCEVNTRCDGYLKNCVTDPYSFSVNIDPDNHRVTMGSSQIKADFSNLTEVAFHFTKYTFHINKYEYSAILSAENEVRYGWCAKVEPAW